MVKLRYEDDHEPTCTDAAIEHGFYGSRAHHRSMNADVAMKQKEAHKKLLINFSGAVSTELRLPECRYPLRLLNFLLFN